MFAVLLLLACDRPGGRVEEAPLATHRGEGFAIAVPEGARVLAEPTRLDVDAADGTRWFTVRLLGASDVPAAELQGWAQDTCETIRWDRTARPVPGIETTGGLCTIDLRRFWLLSAVEAHGEQRLLVVYAADARSLTFEDAWVDWSRTALTLGTTAPIAAPDPAVVRQKARDVVAAGGVGRAPVPGGGELSAHLSEALSDLWQTRASTPAPAAFAAP